MQLLEKLESAEKEERKKIFKSMDNNSYIKLLNHFYKNYEMSTIISQEIGEIVEEINLLPIANLLQKVIKSFQIQLNKFLLYQFHYIHFVKSKREPNSNTNTNSLANIVSDSELQVIDPSMFSNSSFNLGALKSNKKNAEESVKKAFNVALKNYKTKMTQFKKENDKNEKIEKIMEENNKSEDLENNQSKENSKTPSQQELDRNIQMERNLADMNNLLDNKEKRFEELNMLEARNIAAHSELVDVRNDIHKNKNSHVIYTGENLDFLMETEKMNVNMQKSEETENDDVLRIPYFAKSRARVLKQTVKVKNSIKEEVEGEKSEAGMEEEKNVVSQSHKTRVKVNMHDLRNVGKPSKIMKNRGTEPDPEIFDINRIYALDVLVERKTEEIDKLEKELRLKGIMLTELESLLNVQKGDLKTARENFEKSLTKLAEFKLVEANYNLEDNNLKKTIMHLQNDIGKMEVKCEKKEEEIEELRVKEKNLSFFLKELQKKFDTIEEENTNLRRELNFFKLDNQKRIEGYSEKERKYTDKFLELENVIVKIKKTSTIEISGQENYISDLQRNFDIVLKENLEMQEEISNLEHKVAMLSIENDKSIVTSPRRDSSQQSKDNILAQVKTPRVLTDKSEENNDKIAVGPVKVPRLRFESEFAKYSPRALSRNPTESKETQTNPIVTLPAESQTSPFDITFQFQEKRNPAELPLSSNRGNNNSLEEFLKKSSKPIQVINSPSNNINNIHDLVQASPINKYIYPTKIVENLKKKNGATPTTATKNQVFFPTEAKKRELEIKINQSLENNFTHSVEKLQINSATDRYEPTQIKKQSFEKKERERHMSFNEKAMSKILNRQETAKSVYFENGKNAYEKQTSIDRKKEEIQEELSDEGKKSIFEMTNEEKEKKINQMFAKFKKKNEESLYKFSSAYKLPKRQQQKKFKNEEFDEDKLQNFNDFRDFFLKFVEIHRKCGKDCAHLKMFYDRIGWTEEKITAFRQEIRPYKTVINSLPPIKN